MIKEVTMCISGIKAMVGCQSPADVIFCYVVEQVGLKQRLNITASLYCIMKNKALEIHILSLI